MPAPQSHRNTMNRPALPKCPPLFFAAILLAWLAWPVAAAGSLSLSQALDQDGLTVSVAGDSGWTSQTSESHDGLDAARSGAIGDSESSVMEVTVTGPGEVGFWWKVSSQSFSDQLSFSINGVVQGSPISGNVDWREETFSIGPGSHLLRWTYSKDGFLSLGQDAAWVDRLWIPVQGPPQILEEPEGHQVGEGQNTAFTVSAGGGMLSYQWFEGQTGDTSRPVAAATGPMLVTPPLHAERSYWVRISNSAGSADSATATATLGSRPTRLLATGYNAGGQLGDGTTETRRVPVEVAADVVAMAGGGGSSFLVRSDRSLWATGSNSQGQLGDGTTTSRRVWKPVADEVRSVSAHYEHSLFVKTDSTLWVTGANWHGEFGDGTTDGSSLPVQVAAEVRSAAAGGSHSLIVKTDGTLWTTGRNNHGQLGDGTTIDRSTLAQVASEVVMAVAGFERSFFLKTDGTLWAMGRNVYGQLGDGTRDDRPTPVQVASDVAWIAASDNHSLFVKTDGSLWSFGINNDGQLGTGSTNSSDIPVRVAEQVVRAAAGTRHSMFLKVDGTLWGMGSSSSGEIGDGSSTRRYRPVRVATEVTGLAAGASHTLIRDRFPAIAVQPPDVSVAAGASPTLSVVANGAGPISFQWYQGSSGDISQPIPGATEADYPVPPLAATASFWVRVTTPLGSVDSRSAEVLVVDLPVIDEGPEEQVIASGGHAVLSVASASGGVGYQWFEGMPGDISRPVPGAIGALLVTPPVRAATSFWVRLTNAAGTADSGAATVSIGPPVAKRLLAMGSNEYGQLGDGTTEGRSTPTHVLSGVAAVAAGDHHSLFIGTDRSLWATGANWYGQLGDGTQLDRSQPVRVAADVAMAAAGSGHSLFVKTNGTLWAMGRNDYGRLGDGTTTRRLVPVQVAEEVVSAAAAEDFSLFVKSDGTLWAMGRNGSSQLGDGTTESRMSPVQVAEDVVAAAAGEAHGLFLKSDGTLWGMGHGFYGQLGQPGNANQPLPVQIASGVAAMAAGEYHTLYLTTDGTLWATGSNGEGQLGDGTDTTRYQPVKIDTGVTAVAAGTRHSLYVTQDGTLRAMGNNGSSRLGDGTTVFERWSPVEVASSVVAVAGGLAHSLVLDLRPSLMVQPAETGTPAGGAVLLEVTAAGPGPLGYQWFEGETGDISKPVPGATGSSFTTPPVAASTRYWVRVSNPHGHSDSRSALVRVVTPPTILEPPAPQAINPGENVALQVAAEGGLLSYQWFAGTPGDTSAPVTGGSSQVLVTPPLRDDASFWVRVTNAAGSIDSAAAVITTTAPVPGRLSGTGKNQSGELGDGTVENRTVPTLMADEVVRHAAGEEFSLFVKSEGTLWGTGKNIYGQLGDEITANRTDPSLIATDVTFVAAGRSHSLFGKQDGSLWVMGANFSGQLGDGTTTTRRTPVEVATGVIAAAAGSDHSLFLKEDHSLWAMGSNNQGELGDGTTTNRSTPVQVAENVVAVAAAYEHSAFVTADGTLWTVGYNSGGQLGDGTETDRSTPVPVAERVAVVAVGRFHTLFVQRDGSLWAMGRNSSGQLGDGTSSERLEPVFVTGGVRGVGAGQYHSHYVTLDGSLWAMGWNESGQLGDGRDGSASSRVDPVMVASAVASVSAGDSHTLIRDLIPSITIQPADTGVPAGGAASFSVSVSGAGPVGYQWFAGASGDESNPLPGETSATLTAPPAAEDASYWVRVTNPYGRNDSRTALVKIVMPPVITGPPGSQVVANGESAVLTLSAEGGVLEYEWFEGAMGDTSRPVPGTAGPRMVSLPVRADTSFWVRVGNAAGTVDSAAATVTVGPPVAGRLLATGRNSYGQLGDGGNEERTSFGVMATGVTAFAAGDEHSLFVTADGSLWGMGDNYDGRLGDGAAGQRRYVPVRTAHGAVRVAAGADHSLFIKEDGSLWAMGTNSSGQLGDGTQTRQTEAVEVAAGVVAVSAAGQHSLFITDDGSLWGMGANSNGQLGGGATSVYPTPFRIAGDVAMASAGRYHSLFVKTDGTLWAMGSNAEGRLGDGSMTQHLIPVQVAEGVVRAAAGDWHSLFLKTDGTVWAMGDNGYGRLGDGTTLDRIRPVRVAAGAVGISAGASHSHFLMADRSVRAAGWNAYGQLGDGTEDSRPSPVEVGTSALSVEAGAWHTLMLDGLPAISNGPEDTGAPAGGNAVLAVTATGPGPLSYQWFAGTPGDIAAPLAGATGASLEVAAPADAEDYWVRVTNDFGSTDSRGARVETVTSPAIATGPEPRSAENGAPTSLSVAADGGMLAYQWFEGASGDTSRPVSGATSPVLSLPPRADDASFWVRVSNAAGTIDSTEARVTRVVPVAATLRSMGTNTFGQLGNGSMTSRLRPAPMAEDVTQVAAGTDHVLILKTDGSVWAMGDNGYGQLGDGTTSDRNLPVEVAQDVTSVAAGRSTSMILKSDNSLWAVGFRISPSLVRIATDVTAAAASSAGLYYRTTDGRLWRFDRGRAFPVTTDVKDVAAGESHVLFIKEDRSLWAMGDNRSGQLGDGTTDPRWSPVRVAEDVARAAGGYRHSLFLKTDGSLWGMGSSYWGQLGTILPGDFRGDVPALRPMLVATRVVAIAAGWEQSAFVTRDGQVHACGQNAVGQLGDGTTVVPARPVAIDGPRPVVQAAPSREASYYLEVGGILWSAGPGNSGQLGAPVPADTREPAPTAEGITTIAAGEEHTLWITADGTLQAMGANHSGQLGDGTTEVRQAPVTIDTSVRSVAAGSGHSLYLKTDGTLWAMGGNASGQLGDGTRDDRPVPVAIAGDVVLASAGEEHSLFLKRDGTLWAMGRNSDGQLGDGTGTLRSTPVMIAGEVTMAAAGGRHSLFVRNDGSLWAMGRNYDGQLGDGTGVERFVPVRIADGVVAIAAGERHSLFVTADGTLRAMGDNSSGQLGASDTADRHTPVTIAISVTDVTAGATHSLFRKADGWLWAMGANRFGELGDGTTIRRSTPQRIAGDVLGPAAGQDFSLFLSSTSGQPTPAIAGHPASGFVASGATAALTVTASGAGPLGYQWFRGVSGDDSDPITGATGAAYETEPVTEGSRRFWVRVTGPAGSADSQTARLKPIAAPAILGPPEPVTVRPGAHGFLSVRGSPESFTYQWYEGASGDTTRPVAGATGASMVTPAVLEPTSFWVRLANPAGSIDSPAASVTPGVTGRALRIVGAGHGRERELLGESVMLAATGTEHSLFVTTGGTLWAIGENRYGQLGDGTTLDRDVPVRIAEDVIDAAAGEAHSLFVTADGSLWAMGDNSQGQLGDGSRTDRSTPVKVATRVVRIAAGREHSLFVRDDGSLWGMGDGSRGILGLGSISDQLTPVRIAEGVVAAAAGAGFSHFVREDGTLWGTGSNGAGQLGNGTTGFYEGRPVLVAEDVVAVWASTGAGDSNPFDNPAHTLFLRRDGTLHGMGANEAGQLGGGPHPRLYPGLIADDVVAAAAGGRHSLFRKADGRLWAVGDNSRDQISEGHPSEIRTPILVADGAGDPAAAESHSLILADAGAEPAPTLVAHPSSDFVPAGRQGELTVGTDGDGAMSYQWYEGLSGDTSRPVADGRGGTLVTPALDATTRFWVRAHNTAGFTDSRSAILAVEEASAGYVVWADGFGLIGTEVAPSADSDHDGKNNFVEFATGGDPTRPDGARPVRLDVPAAGSARIMLTLSADESLAFAFDFADDLSGWRRVDLSFDGDGWSVGDPALSVVGAELLEPELWRLVLEPAVGGGRVFVRLVVGWAAPDP